MARPSKAAMPPQEMKARIVETAEELFRSFGYSKTTVADIAAVLAMSPANVYRYFESKAAITEAICERVLERIESRCLAVLREEGTAAWQLKRFVLEYHRAVKENILKEKRLHDMVTVAIEQNWSNINRHALRILENLQGLLHKGITSGEFQNVDLLQTAKAFRYAIVGFVYPALVEKAVEEASAEGVEDTLEDDLALLLHMLCAAIQAGRKAG